MRGKWSRSAPISRRSERGSVVVPVAMAVPVAVSIAVLVVLVVAMVASAVVALVVGRHIDVVVPRVLHEEDALTAGVILVAVLGPVLRVARRNVQVHRRSRDAHVLDDDRLREDQGRRREAADLDV